MERVISATEARVHFGALLRRVVEQGETVVVERGGRPQAVVIEIDEYRRLRAAQDNQEPWPVLLDRAHAQLRAELGDRELPIDDVIHAMREERDAQLIEGLH